MADLEDLGYQSIADIDTDQALELLRQIRLGRRIRTKPAKETKPKSERKTKQSAEIKLTPELAAQLLAKLTGG